MEKIKFGCPECAVAEQFEGDLYHPRLKKKPRLAENVYWCERCDNIFLVLKMPKKHRI